MIKKYLPKSEFAKNVLTLMTGTTIGQAIPVLVSPIVTRLYSPEEYGVFAIFLSITAILSVISTGRYEFAIVVTEEEETALNLTALSIIISFFLSVFSFALILAFDSEFSNLLGQPSIAIYLYFVPLALFLNGVYQTFAQLLNRKKEYSIISAGKIAHPTLAAQFSIVPTSTRLPTFTPPPSLVVPSYTQAPPVISSQTGSLAIIIIALAVLGMIGFLLSLFLRR